MNPDLERRLLVDQYRAFLEICHERGLEIQPVSDEELQELDNFDLRRLVRQTRDLTRSPLP